MSTNPTPSLENLPPFDPAATVNAIRDKIKLQLLEVIPNERWDALILAELKAFTHDHKQIDQWNRTVDAPAGFKVIVRQLLEEKAREDIKKFLESPETFGGWDGQGIILPSELVKEFLAEKGPEILQACFRSIMGTMMQSVLQDMRNRL